MTEPIDASTPPAPFDGLDRAVDAAAKAMNLHDWHPTVPSSAGAMWTRISRKTQDSYRARADVALAAALPVVLAELAEQIEGMRMHIPPSSDADRMKAIVQRSTCNRAAARIRSFAEQVSR